MSASAPQLDRQSIEATADEELMRRFCRGDAAAYGALFDRHVARVRGYLYRITRRADVADDLTQLTFLSVARARDRFLPGSAFRPWLFSIATNAAKDYRRRSALAEENSQLHEADWVEEAVPVDRPLMAGVHRALSQLPEPQRVAVMLHRFEGLSFQEIAASQGVSESAVKVRAHRGYQSLRKLLASLWQEVSS